MSILELTGKETEAQVLNELRESKNAVFVFYSPGCPHCHRLRAFIGRGIPNYKVVYCNSTLPFLDKYSADLGIQSVPSTHIFRDGRHVEEVMGFNETKMRRLFNL